MGRKKQVIKKMKIKKNMMMMKMLKMMVDRDENMSVLMEARGYH